MYWLISKLILILVNQNAQFWEIIFEEINLEMILPFISGIGIATPEYQNPTVFLKINSGYCTLYHPVKGHFVHLKSHLFFTKKSNEPAMSSQAGQPEIEIFIRDFTPTVKLYSKKRKEKNSLLLYSHTHWFNILSKAPSTCSSHTNCLFLAKIVMKLLIKSNFWENM